MPPELQQNPRHATANPALAGCQRQRQRFELPDDVTYLNCAYQSPKLRASIEAAERELRRSFRPWTFSPHDFFAPAEELRGLFARLIGASADDIAIVPSASYGIATAARNLANQARQGVVMLEEQFPSNVYAWTEPGLGDRPRVRFIDRPAEASRNEANRNGANWSDAIIEAIGSGCGVAALPGVHWTDGYRLDLEGIGRACSRAGAALVLDLTQSLGAVPFSVSDVEVDFAVASSYKWLLGPLGLAFLYVNPRHHGGRPIEFNWLAREGSEDFSRLVHYTDRYQAGARRFDAGGRTNSSLNAHAACALAQILEWGVDNIAAHLGDLTANIAAHAARRGLGCTAEERRSPHMLGIELPASHLQEFPAALAAEQVHVSLRGSKLRVSPYVYNSERDVERLFDAVDRVL